MAFFWNRKSKPSKKSMAVEPRPRISGHKFTLKGSPRHYDDVEAIIQDGGHAAVYFGEALMYERGAGVAEWRIIANSFDWLPTLYDWWAEAERVEPIRFTFHLYHPDNLHYPVLDLREHTPKDVADYIRANTPRVENAPVTTKPSRASSGQPDAASNFGGRHNKGG